MNDRSLVRGSWVKLFRDNAKRTPATPWVDCGSRERALFVKGMWKRERKVPAWFHKCFAGTDGAPEFDDLVKQMGEYAKS